MPTEVLANFILYFERRNVHRRTKVSYDASFLETVFLVRRDKVTTALSLPPCTLIVCTNTQSLFQVEHGYN